jgi:tetratricopeptide (TPR) repeat protein
MTPERWQQIRDVLEKALELAPSERSAFLKRACSSDPTLRQEVETLLASSDGVRSSFLQSSFALRVTLTPGTKLGDYEVKSLLGSGGMGEVYRARDSRLEREVAIKVLPSFLSVDSDRLRRFEQEARVAAALNHPNILAVHQMGTYEGAPYLVSELLEGETLREQIKRGPLSVRKAIDYGVQIARGLAAAHEKGIVHRDLKPENLFVTKDGRVKILDFGLAKLTQPQSGSVHSAPTVTDGTEPGMVMGTVGYMSPEQVRAQTADHRSDIFAFGATLYEMLAGKQAFQKPTSADTMSAILNEDPPGISQVTTNVPPALQRVVHRCLEKNPELRFQSASDLAFDLDALSESGGSAPSATAAKAATGSGKRWKVIVPAAVTVLALLVGVYFYSHRRPKLTDKDTIVLSDFDNKTGDAVFDDTLKQGLSVQLEQSPFLALISERRVNETLKLMGRPAGDRLPPEVTHEVCQRTGSKAMLTGSIAGLGSQYVIGLKAVNCNTGDVLAEAQEQAAGKEAVLKALDAAAISLRGKLGESLSSVQKYATPLEEATTPSLEALKVYSLGLKTWAAKGDTAALPFYKRAVELDPNFAMAYAQLSVLYHDLNEAAGAAENGRKAYDLREKVSERERFWIESGYYDLATEELEKGAQTDELWLQTYPRDAMPYTELGFVSATQGNWEKALEEWQVAVRLDPNNGLLYYVLSLAYMSQNRLDETEAVFKQAEEHKLDNEQLLQGRYWLAFLKGDTAQMGQLVSTAMGKPGSEDLLLAAQADTEGWHGRLKNAHDLTRRAMDSAQRNDAKETAAGYQAEAALREVEAGNREHGRAEANAALKLAPNRDVRAMAALALARAVDTAAAEKLAAELDKTFPLDTMVQRYWLPTIRAAVALGHKDPNRAIELLKVASTNELSTVTADLTIFLCPVYLRGEAYLMLHDGNRAAAEFQKFIDHRGVVMNFPWGALARLGVARAYAMLGDKAKARTAYQDFLTLWKDADPDVPILKEAKAEYAKLQ